jgi:hypothetical protein
MNGTLHQAVGFRTKALTTRGHVRTREERLGGKAKINDLIHEASRGMSPQGNKHR